MNREHCIYNSGLGNSIDTSGNCVGIPFYSWKKIPFGNLKLGDVKNRKIRFEVRAKLWPC